MLRKKTPAALVTVRAPIIIDSIAALEPLLETEWTRRVSAELTNMNQLTTDRLTAGKAYMKYLPIQQQEQIFKHFWQLYLRDRDEADDGILFVLVSVFSEISDESVKGKIYQESIFPSGCDFAFNDIEIISFFAKLNPELQNKLAEKIFGLLKPAPQDTSATAADSNESDAKAGSTRVADQESIISRITTHLDELSFHFIVRFINFLEASPEEAPRLQRHFPFLTKLPEPTDEAAQAVMRRLAERVWNHNANVNYNNTDYPSLLFYAPYYSIKQQKELCNKIIAFRKENRSVNSEDFCDIDKLHPDAIAHLIKQLLPKVPYEIVPAIFHHYAAPDRAQLLNLCHEHTLYLIIFIAMKNQREEIVTEGLNALKQRGLEYPWRYLGGKQEELPAQYQQQILTHILQLPEPLNPELIPDAVMIIGKLSKCGDNEQQQDCKTLILFLLQAFRHECANGDTIAAACYVALEHMTPLLDREKECLPLIRNILRCETKNPDAHLTNINALKFLTVAYQHFYPMYVIDLVECAKEHARLSTNQMLFLLPELKSILHHCFLPPSKKPSVVLNADTQLASFANEASLGVTHGK